MKKKKKKITKAILKKKAKRQAKHDFKVALEIWKASVVERDRGLCQKCLKSLPNKINQNVHHIISLNAVKRKYPELLSDTNNGILLCPYCHKWASDSPHQGGFEFTEWLKYNKPAQFNYLNLFLITKR